MCKFIRKELSIEYRELDNVKYPYTRMHFKIYCDDYVIEEGYSTVRDMFLYFDRMLETIALPLQ